MSKLKNVLLGFISLSVTLVFLELVFGLVFPQQLSGSWRTVSEKGYLLNKANWKSIHRFGDREVEYRFNSLHMRGGEINPEDNNLLVLGDSYSFGWLLEEDSSFIGRLQNTIEKRHPNKNIRLLNASAGGWGLADQLDYFEEFGAQILPKQTIVMFNFTSLENSLNRSKYVNTDDFRYKMKSLLNNSLVYQWFLENSHLVQWVRNQLIQSSLQGNEPNMLGVSESKTSELNVEAIETGNKLFVELKEKCASLNSKLIVVVPAFNWKGKTISDAEFAFLTQADSVFNSLAIPFYNLENCIENNIESKGIDTYVIPGEYHPNAQGSAIIAKCIYDELNPMLEKF